MKDDWENRHKYMNIVYCIGVRNKVDNLDKWLNLQTPQKNSITPMSASKVSDIAFKNQTTNECEKILLSLDEKGLDEFKEWVKKPDKQFPDKKDHYLRTVDYLEKREVKVDFSLE